MINEVRNSVGFRNLATAKKQRARAPYSATFQPLLTEVEAVDSADMIEPYSVEQTLHDINEELEEHEASEADVAELRDQDDVLTEAADTDRDRPEQTRLYSSAGHMQAPDLHNEPAEPSREIDDDMIVETLLADLSSKIEASFQFLESNIQQSIEKRLSQAMLGVFKKQMVAETTEKLRQAISNAIGQRSDIKIVISGPKELIETFQNHLDDQGDEGLNLSFSVNEASSDLVVQIDETSITSRFDELDALVLELFE